MHLTGLYILVNGEPVPEPDVLRWAQWRGEHEDEQRIALDTDAAGCWVVSTIFLGIDYRLLPERSDYPLVFETMLFVRGQPAFCQRYSSRDAAVAGHVDVLGRVEQLIQRGR